MERRLTLHGGSAYTAWRIGLHCMEDRSTLHGVSDSPPEMGLLWGGLGCWQMGVDEGREAMGEASFGTRLCKNALCAKKNAGKALLVWRKVHTFAGQIKSGKWKVESGKLKVES